ncbi:D-alanyl-D-alanine carboxypeptidase family protein [Candidatus Formimonas warabiya]|uniref:serine-type D-Ala-D-Ala carboxypeptidase n=1 Tax=Formimonas warabiya TaxID=1761012 RepID=A0A3G1KNP8_FORW1|nr:D-alanyl-D-alanine carboxypeptidase family protein [Candidatus Formimonas warabiya]ATW24093.1 hypothetical protein DCMF_04220 [Candidatus Formimonas warabiya]
MKRFFIFLLTLFTFYWGISGVAFAALELSAKSAILIDASSGRVLFEKNAHESLPQASTTKITTALIALEQAKLTKRIRVPDNFVNPGESNIYLEPGEVQTLEDLMYALLLKSANDAAEAIAIGIAGSEEKFVAMMNERVRELGLKNTHYTNPHGLHNDDHYTSAYDLAMIAREALKHKEFQDIIVTNRHLLSWPGHDYSRVVYNANKLLKTYEGADGVKNGYTKQAGNCLVGSATRDGMQLIAVVLHSNGMYDEVSALLDYGFQNYQKKNFYGSRQLIKDIMVEGGKTEQIRVFTKSPVSVALRDSEIDQVHPKIYLPDSIKAPVKAGQRLGAVVIQINKDMTVTTELIAGDSVNQKSFFAYLWYKFISAFDLFLA